MSDELPETIDPDDRPLPVLAQTRVLDRPPARLVATPALAATGGFIVGVVTFLLTRALRRGRRGRLVLGRRSRPLEIQSSRSFLVDVHVLKR